MNQAMAFADYGSLLGDRGLGSEAGSVVDCGIHNALTSPTALLPYVAKGWRDYLSAHLTPEWQAHLAGRAEQPNVPANLPFVQPTVGYHNPQGDKLLDSAPGGQAPGSNHQAVSRYLDESAASRGVLCHDAAMLTPALPNAHLSVELARAYNDWMLDEWLTSRDPRLYGLIIVPNQVPDAAAEEIRRVGQNSRMVGVLMAANGLGKPLGHPAYHPIYKAAEQLGLPIVTHAGAERVMDALAYPAAAGLPATVTDYRALRDQAQASYVVNMIAQGVFERFPTLRVLVLGAGVTWVAPLLWRFDTDAKALRRDAPWLKRLPSEYFRQFFRVGTFPFAGPASSDQMVKYLNAFRNIESILCFASGYPDIDSDSAMSVSDTLPQDWRAKVMGSNALDFFRWPSRSVATGAATTTTGRGVGI